MGVYNNVSRRQAIKFFKPLFRLDTNIILLYDIFGLSTELIM